MEKEDVKSKELAERMGCMRQNVSQMLNRGTVNMRYDSFYRMADALGYEIILRKNEITVHLRSKTIDKFVFHTSDYLRGRYIFLSIKLANEGIKERKRRESE